MDKFGELIQALISEIPESKAMTLLADNEQAFEAKLQQMALKGGVDLTDPTQR